MSRHWIGIERAANGGYLITGPAGSEHPLIAAVSTTQEMIEIVTAEFEPGETMPEPEPAESP